MYDRGIEAFLAIASCHSISGAADLLHITQSAVSHRLRELENQIGMTLVDRQKGLRRSDLTLAGENFLPIAERWSQLWRETQQAKSSLWALFLKIGCVDSVNTYLLPKLYLTLPDSQPPVHLKISTMSSVDLYERIERRELDVAFVGTEIHHPKVKIAPFYREPMQVIRHRRKGTSSRTVRAADLDPAFELFVPWSPPHQIWHDRIWNPSRTARIEPDTLSLLQALLEDARHWAIAPKSVMENFRRNRRLIVQELDPSPPDRITLMITHQLPRVGARQGIEILEAVARKMGFLAAGEKNHLGGNRE
jgi:DNA-binding transcriptional LysR family regulator